jgi:transcriptional regulator GlxA family with amidase domain
MTQPRSVTFVIFDGFQSLDLVGPFEVFTQVEVLSDSRYDTTVVAPREGPFRSSRGLTVTPDQSLTATDPRSVDTLVVAGGDGVFAARTDRALVDWIAAAAASARRTAAVCSGAFLLAEAGLLDGRRVTTHWKEADRLAREYPDVVVDRDPIFITDGSIWTSAGVTAGMDLALALVEADLGHQVALTIAQDMVMYLRRPGSQSQFSVPLWSAQPASDPLRVVVDAIHTDPGARHDIAELAERAGLSPRHLQRRFTREVGLSPAAYVERVRIEAAQHALAERDDPVDTIARRFGFGTAETLRRTFHRQVGIAPSDYRARFRATPALGQLQPVS